MRFFDETIFLHFLQNGLIYQAFFQPPTQSAVLAPSGLASGHVFRESPGSKTVHHVRKCDRNFELLTSPAPTKSASSLQHFCQGGASPLTPTMPPSTTSAPLGCHLRHIWHVCSSGIWRDYEGGTTVRIENPLFSNYRDRLGSTH